MWTTAVRTHTCGITIFLLFLLGTSVCHQGQESISFHKQKSQKCSEEYNSLWLQWEQVQESSCTLLEGYTNIPQSDNDSGISETAGTTKVRKDFFRSFLKTFHNLLSGPSEMASPKVNFLPEQSEMAY